MDYLLLNKKFETISVLDVYESVIWTDRYSSYGDFEFYTSASKDNIDMFKEGFYVWGSESKHLMILGNTKIESDVEFGNHLTIEGKSLEFILGQRIIWNQTILNGSLQDMILKLLNENIINPTDSNRKIENFIFSPSEDSRITSLKIETQFTGDNLYEAIKAICDVENIGFSVILNEQNQFVFSLYMGIDRSYAQLQNPYVVFSQDFDNIINSNYYEKVFSYKNVGLVAGEGEGSLRKTSIVGNSEVSGIDRKELYIDARDLSTQTPSGTISDAQYQVLLQNRGNERLETYKKEKEFSGEIETTQMFKYGKDFFMGDIVQLENEYGSKSSARIMEFIYHDGKEGSQNYPTFDILDEETG